MQQTREVYGIPVRTQYEFISAGKLESFVLNRRRYIRAESLERLIASAKDTALPSPANRKAPRPPPELDSATAE